jgi:hypothetical protein
MIHHELINTARIDYFDFGLSSVFNIVLVHDYTYMMTLARTFFFLCIIFLLICVFYGTILSVCSDSTYLPIPMTTMTFVL